jgi:hypothetical protein
MTEDHEKASTAMQTHIIMGMQREELRKIWCLHFIEEEGLEAGGLRRDWLQNITSQHGLFISKYWKSNLHVHQHQSQLRGSMWC